MIDFVDEVEESAIRSNAINTVYKVKDKIIGANTDGIGFISSLKKDLSFNINSKTNVMCIGAGGAAYGVVSSLIDLSPNIISIINRTKASGKKLIKHFEKFTQSISYKTNFLYSQKIIYIFILHLLKNLKKCR